ncbi:uncharacterized protein Dmoj_GI25509 [Drosophila mojavensis]|uniref:Uncharacterized protein n=1 Tax=Drosophila mojavensis TaxID=7230 RepID=A0A0Q9XBD0_DROMO|nr:uncharacterized protein Dmoj_GI25509 [Drosophila mojavensis]
MFNELIAYMHSIARKLFLARPVPVARGTACRPLVKNSFFANLIFFIAIFSPYYVCCVHPITL